MTTPTEDLIARIETEVRAWETTRVDGSSGLAFEGLLTESAQALRALQQEVERLRGAVGPFARMADKISDTWTDESMPVFNHADGESPLVAQELRVRHFRAARSALTGSAQG